MSNEDDIREFLATRRAKVSPEHAGLPTYGRRRVAGLRREEVAFLAGISASTTRAWSEGRHAESRTRCSMRYAAP